ncbi:MAG TPA: hypothetical protein PLF27_07175 [Sedimentibacter sp.]|nr:hypothetical protein [Sedimentibacter sp.]
MAENALLEKMLDLPEFTITDLQHNDYDIRIYVAKKDKLEEPQIYPSEWEILRESLPRELYRKLELRLLEEFKPQE